MSVAACQQLVQILLFTSLLSMMSALPVLLRSGGSPAFGGERDPQLQTPNTSKVAYAEDLCRLSWGRLPLGTW